MTTEQQLFVIDLQIEEVKLMAQWYMTYASLSGKGQGKARTIAAQDRDCLVDDHMHSARCEIAKLERLADKKIKIIADNSPGE